jgi:hypothetical protein
VEEITRSALRGFLNTPSCSGKNHTAQGFEYIARISERAIF